MSDPAPIIVSALFEPVTQARLEALRRTHFPPERNRLAAHLTLFHHLPPSIERELGRRLALLTEATPPQAHVTGVMNLGRGTALRIDAPDLVTIRRDLADAFDDLLIPQDRAGWRPHVTIQNKVDATAARTLQTMLEPLAPIETRIAALASWRYRDGPWERIARYAFRG